MDDLSDAAGWRQIVHAFFAELPSIMGVMNIKAALALTSVLIAARANSVSAVTTDRGFMVEAQAAMSKMMNAMAIAPSGDVDTDFVAEMVPHHQSAIDMARSELRFGRNEALRRIAQEIVITQEDEIVAMKRALARHEDRQVPVGP